MIKRIFLYGIAGIEDNYRIARYMSVDVEYISIRDLIDHALWLKNQNQSIEHVYAIDNTRVLAHNYRDVIRDKSFESFCNFKNMLERNGVMII